MARRRRATKRRTKKIRAAGAGKYAKCRGGIYELARLASKLFGKSWQAGKPARASKPDFAREKHWQVLAS